VEPIDKSVIEDIGDAFLLILKYSRSGLILIEAIVFVHLVNMVKNIQTFLILLLLQKQFH